MSAPTHPAAATRTALPDLDERRFDVVVIGGGAAGSSAAQNLAARGYQTLLIDKGDFASGTSSRSSRLLYCGLAYLSPDYPLWTAVTHPRDIMRRLWMARLAMRCRTQLVESMPERLRPCTFVFPIFRDGAFPAWQVDLGYRILGLFGSTSAPLNYRRLTATEAAAQFGLVALLNQRRLDSVGVFTEYQYDWAERICIDTVLDAERLGAVVRNYTNVTAMRRRADDSWLVDLEDMRSPGMRAAVAAAMVVNTAGPWADRVNAMAVEAPTRRLVGIKGVNVLVKLPDACQGLGMETISSIGQPYYVMPWGRYHFFGPTETVYDGDPDEVRVLPEEVDHILGEANRLFPSLSLSKRDIVYSWCGVRPRTASAEEEGVKALAIHDMACDGMPNVLTLTGTPIMLHRYAGAELAAQVARTLRPSGSPRPLSHAARLSPENQNSPPLDYDEPQTKIADLRFAAANEHPQTLVDLLFRRVPIGWTAGMGIAAARRAAEAVADILGWDEARIDQEVSDYRRFVAAHFDPTVLKPPATSTSDPRPVPDGVGGRTFTTCVTS